MRVAHIEITDGPIIETLPARPRHEVDTDWDWVVKDLETHDRARLVADTRLPSSFGEGDVLRHAVFMKPDARPVDVRLIDDGSY